MFAVNDFLCVDCNRSDDDLIAVRVECDVCVCTRPRVRSFTVEFSFPPFYRRFDPDCLGVNGRRISEHDLRSLRVFKEAVAFLVELPVNRLDDIVFFVFNRVFESFLGVIRGLILDSDPEDADLSHHYHPQIFPCRYQIQRGHH